MSTIYKLLDFKWWGIDSTLYLSDSYNNTSGFDDSSQVVGSVSGIIRYNFLNTTFSTPSRDYYWLIYFRQLPTQKNPPHTVGFRTDRWSTITAKTGNHFQITHNGISYWVYKSAAVSYVPSRDEWQITSDNVDSNPVFVNEGTSKKNTVHDLGDKTGSTEQQIYLEGLTYLLNEPAYGRGTVTLSIKKPGQTLNFASRLLGKTVSQYISGDDTIDMSSDLVIFENGSFSNVISGFDIANYQSCGEGSISSLSAYYNTSWGLYEKQQNALPFVVENGLIAKTMRSTPGATAGSYFIPINRASGFTKIHIRTKLQELQSSIYNFSLTWGAAVVNNQMVYSSQEADVLDDQVMTDYILDISDLPYVDYIKLGGCDGKPVWEYIALEN